MKKIGKTGLILIVVLYATIAVVTGCANETDNRQAREREGEMEKSEIFDPLSEETKNRIIKDWQEQFGFPLHPDAYVHYGTFNNVVVLFIEGDAAIVTTMTVAGVTFVYPYDFNIYVWSENVFFTLSDAYQNNILKQENIAVIGETHKKIYQESLKGEL